jgi:hypothetical protein
VVCTHGARVLGLDKLYLHLTEVQKGVAPAPPGRAAAGVRGPEASLEPHHGLIQVGYQVSNVLNLVKHHLPFACKVYDANVRRIIGPFSL